MTPLPWELSRQLLGLLESGASDDSLARWADQATTRLISSHSELQQLLDMISSLTMAPEMKLSRLELAQVAKRMYEIPLEGDYLADALKETPEGYVPLKWTQRQLPPIAGLRLLCMKCMCKLDPHIRDRCDCESLRIDPQSDLVSIAETEAVRFLVPLTPC